MPALSRRLALAASLALTFAGGVRAQPVADMALGNPKAAVTVVEYASLACTHCATFNNTVFPAFKKKYVDTGKVRYVYREFFTQPVQVAAAGALIARCAPKARYFDVIDAFFRGQAAMYESGSASELFIAAGKAGGLNEAQVKACLADEAAIKALNERVQGYAKTEKITSTPTLIVNGKKVEGEATLAALSAAIDPLLKARRR